MSQSSCAFAISGKNEMIGFLPHCLSLHSPSSMMFVSQREVCRIVGEQLSGNKTCPSHMSLLQERKEIAQSLLDGVSFLPTSFSLILRETKGGERTEGTYSEIRDTRRCGNLLESNV